MWLYSSWIFSLWQDLQQLIVRQEVESREGITFGLQVFTETLLDLFQKLVTFAQVIQQAVVWAQGDDLKKSDASMNN